MPTLDETRRFFDGIARRYDRAYSPTSQETRARMASVVARLGSPRRVLDLGVGTGRELPALLDAGHTVTGLDCSDEMIALCSRRARAIPITRADLWGPLPFEPASFDAVLALFGTLAHPPDRGSVARLGEEVARVLAPGGLWYFEVPTQEWVASAGARHVDDVARVQIDIVALDEGEWSLALPRFDLDIERAGGELLVCATIRADIGTPRRAVGGEPSTPRR